MNQYLFIFILLTSFQMHHAVSEKVAFDIVRGGKVVGELIGNKLIEGDKTIYTSHSEATVRLIKQITVVYDFRVVMKGKLLHEADAKITVNDKLHNETSIRLKGKKYQFSELRGKEDDTLMLDYPILYPAILLIFREPKEFVASFSEEDGQFHLLNRIQEHAYQKTSPKGKVNEYFYDESGLKGAHLDAGFFQFKVVRK